MSQNQTQSVGNTEALAQGERGCGNEECGWTGTTDRMCGSIGPLCPDCGETTEALAALPAESAEITIQEAWEAAGGNPGIKPTKAELIETLKLLDEVCDEAAKKKRVGIMFTTDSGQLFPLEWPGELAQRWLSSGKQGRWLCYE